MLNLYSVTNWCISFIISMNLVKSLVDGPSCLYLLCGVKYVSNNVFTILDANDLIVVRNLLIYFSYVSNLFRTLSPMYLNTK